MRLPFIPEQLLILERLWKNHEPLNEQLAGRELGRTWFSTSIQRRHRFVSVTCEAPGLIWEI